jgi:predicted HicB family RNase H-like nuclease
MANRQAYSMKVFWSDEDGEFIAVCPELKGISASGSTHEEAVRELQIGIEAALEVYREKNWKLPEPLDAPHYSGQFRIRISRSLHAQLVAQAEREDVSLNSLVEMKLAAASAVDDAMRKVAAELRAVAAVRQPRSRAQTANDSFSVRSTGPSLITTGRN